VTLRSNRWPGAQAVAYKDKFANIYIGIGLKDLGNPVQNFVPPKLGEIQKEFVQNENAPDVLVEQMDPTLEQERLYEDELNAKNADGKDNESEAGEQEAEDDA
jgi:radial spoke head protein 4A